MTDTPPAANDPLDLAIFFVQQAGALLNERAGEHAQGNGPDVTPGQATGQAQALATIALASETRQQNLILMQIGQVIAQAMMQRAGSPPSPTADAMPKFFLADASGSVVGAMV